MCIVFINLLNAFSLLPSALIQKVHRKAVHVIMMAISNVPPVIITIIFIGGEE